MADEAQTIRSINWREVFPVTNLFKAFRVAVHPSKLVLALAALLLIYFGGRILDGIWADKHLVPVNDAFHVPDMSDSGDSDNRRGIFISFFNHEVRSFNYVIRGALALSPRAIYDAAYEFVVVGPYWLMTEHPFFFTLFAIWFLLIWSIFGGAIARIAAVHVARDEKISVRQALRFSMNKLLSFAFAPLIPLLILLVIGAIVAAGGALLYIPIIGPILLSLLFFLALIAGLVMALVLLGLVGGFNLMYPTIAVEGSDSFDAISRSFSYVFARPWRMLFYTLVAIVYGALTYLFVKYFVALVLGLTHYFVGWWLTGQPETYWPYIFPPPDADHLPYNVRTDQLKWSEDIAAGMIAFWVYLVIGLVGAYAISYFFSVNTIIYYLMRREVDATELEDVYVEETEDEFGETTTTVTSTTVAAAATAPAPASPATSAPGGGVTGTAGSADPGGSSDAGAKPYDAPDSDAPPRDPDSPPV
jgi:hypothetical protein